MPRRTKPTLQPLARRQLAAVAAVVGLAAAGCSNELSKTEYEQKVQTEWADVQQAFRATASGGTMDDVADATERAQDELRSSADELDDVDAPKAVEELNEELIQALRGYADDLDAMIRAARDGDTDAVAAFNGRIGQNRWILQIHEVAEQMRAKGFNLGDLAEE